MTASLKKAFDKAAALPREVQEQLAEQLVVDIEGELKWDRTLSRSQQLLEKLARRALKHHKVGESRPVGFDEL